MKTLRHFFSFTGLCALGLAWASGCGSSKQGSGFGNPGSTSGSTSASGDDAGDNGGGGDDDSGPPGMFGTSDAAPPPMTGCTGLQCQVHSCSNGGTTTLSGKVYDPAGKNALYDIVVYVPNATPKPITTGASCYSCSDLYTGNPITTALTGPDGKFTLTGVPDGQNIPLVVQIGKWRKQYKIPSVAMCTDNPQPDKSLRLPKNHNEGDMPSMAISTGDADSIECLLERIGVDPSEYVGGPGNGARLHIFQGTVGPNGPVPDTTPSAPASSASLWDSKADLLSYDLVLLSCEGAEAGAMNQQALFDYAAAGGRVFASHFHYSWFNSGPFGAANLATWTPTAMPMAGLTNGIIQTALPNGQMFPKGVAMKQWLGNVGALGVNGAPPGELPITEAKHNADVSASNTPSTPWILADQGSQPPNATQYFSFDTPIGAPATQQCGRVVFSDLHVGSASGDYGGILGAGGPKAVPSGCGTGDLSPQEKALEFMLFDLSSCLTPIGVPPVPPKPQPM
jgi:hypothetical protein